MNLPGPSDLDKRRIELLISLERVESTLGFVSLTLLGIILSGFAGFLGRALLWLSLSVFTIEALFQIIRLWFLESYFKDVPCRQVVAHHAMRMENEGVSVVQHLWWPIAGLFARVYCRSRQRMSPHNMTVALALISRFLVTCVLQSLMVALGFCLAFNKAVKTAKKDDENKATVERMIELLVVVNVVAHIQYFLSHLLTTLGFLLLTLKPPPAHRRQQDSMQAESGSHGWRTFSRNIRLRRRRRAPKWLLSIWRAIANKLGLRGGGGGVGRPHQHSSDWNLEDLAQVTPHHEDELLQQQEHQQQEQPPPPPRREDSLEVGVGASAEDDAQHLACFFCPARPATHFCWLLLWHNAWLLFSAPYLVFCQVFWPAPEEQLNDDEDSTNAAILPRIAWYVHLKKHPHLAAEVARYKEDECGLLSHWFFSPEFLARRIKLNPFRDKPVESWEADVEGLEFLSRDPRLHSTFVPHLCSLIAILERNDRLSDFAKTHEYAAVALGNFWEHDDHPGTQACRASIVDNRGIEALIAVAAYSPDKGAKEAALHSLVRMAMADDGSGVNAAFVRAVHTSSGVAVFLERACSGPTPTCQEMSANLLACYALWKHSADELLRPDVLLKLEHLLSSPLAVCRMKVCTIVRLVAANEKLASALLSTSGSNNSRGAASLTSNSTSSSAAASGNQQQPAGGSSATSSSPRVIRALVGALVEGLRLPPVSTGHSRARRRVAPDRLLTDLIQGLVEALGALCGNAECWGPVWSAMMENSGAGLTTLLKLLLPEAPPTSKMAAVNTLWTLLSTSNADMQAEKATILLHASVTERQYNLIGQHYQLSREATHNLPELLVQTAVFQNLGPFSTELAICERSIQILAKILRSFTAVTNTAAANDILEIVEWYENKEPSPEVRERFLRAFSVLLEEVYHWPLEHRSEWIRRYRKVFKMMAGYSSSGRGQGPRAYVLTLLLLGSPPTEQADVMRDIKAPEWQAIMGAMLDGISLDMQHGTAPHLRRALTEEDVYEAVSNLTMAMEDMEVMVAIDQGLHKVIETSGLDRTKADMASQLLHRIRNSRSSWPRHQHQYQYQYHHQHFSTSGTSFPSSSSSSFFGAASGAATAAPLQKKSSSSPTVGNGRYASDEDLLSRHNLFPEEEVDWHKQRHQKRRERGQLDKKKRKQSQKDS